MGEGGSYGQPGGGGVRILLTVGGVQTNGGSLISPAWRVIRFGGCLVIHPVKFLAID